MNDIPLKRCSRGDNCVHPMGCWQPATKEHFNKHKQCKNGLRPFCRACQKADSIEYYSTNKDELSKKASQYAKEHPEQTRKKNQKYETNNRDKRRSQRKENRLKNPETDKARAHRYLSRKQNLPSLFNGIDWNNALDYFHGCCAVCGRQLNDLLGTHKAAADHWIPLASSECLGTIPTNIVPLCHGLNGCNNRKSNRDPMEFLITEFGKRRAKKINDRIEAYFQWVKSQP